MCDIYFHFYGYIDGHWDSLKIALDFLRSFQDGPLHSARRCIQLESLMHIAKIGQVLPQWATGASNRAMRYRRWVKDKSFLESVADVRYYSVGMRRIRSDKVTAAVSLFKKRNGPNRINIRDLGNLSSLESFVLKPTHFRSAGLSGDCVGFSFRFLFFFSFLSFFPWIGLQD